MKRDKKLRMVAVFSAVAVAGAVTVYAAYDSSKDPLVSLSYLSDVFAPEIKSELKSELSSELGVSIKDSLKAELKDEISDEISEDYSATLEALQKQVDALSNEYAVVDLQKGQRLKADASCEIVVLSGIATVRCSASEEGLIDCTDGVILYDGQTVPENHKLLVPDNGDGRGITAVGTVQLLVKGGYTIG